VALLLAVSAPLPDDARAQIVTDRPDFVESSATVGRRAFQIETSIAYEATGSSPARSAAWSTPTLLRFGLGETWELRFESDLVVRDASSPALPGDGGLADAALGVKWHVLDASGSLPSTALLAHVEVPTGSRALRGDGPTPSLRAVGEWTLPGGMSAGIMPGVRVRPANDRHRVEGILGVVVGATLVPSLRAFGELAFERLAAARHGGVDGTWNAGLAWLVTDMLQLDAAVSLAATREASDFGMTVGVSHILATPREDP